MSEHSGCVPQMGPLHGGSGSRTLGGWSSTPTRPRPSVDAAARHWGPQISNQEPSTTQKQKAEQNGNPRKVLGAGGPAGLEAEGERLSGRFVHAFGLVQAHMGGSPRTPDALDRRRSREATWSQPPRFCGAGEQSQPGCFFQEKEGEARTQHGPPAPLPPTPPAQAHPQPAVTLQAVTLRVALGVSRAKRAGVPPAAFPGSARRGHQRDRQGSGLSRQGCLRGVVGFAPTQLPSASAEPGRPCSSTGAHQAASPATGPRGPRIHPDIPTPPAGRHLALLTHQPLVSSPLTPPPGAVPSSRSRGRGPIPRGRTKPGPFALCRKPSRGHARGRGQLHGLPVKMASLHRFANSRAICVVGDGIQAPSRDAPPSSPPFPGPTPARLRPSPG
uniref:Uncharacterized protein n=1 Tax=Rangifer tarandus platyrhynchus TaxID=3082113 RepID=A0ACB0FDM0_RANTA|nr:unnamed protein product [Rangifer tarandus platyrhynchus]